MSGCGARHPLRGVMCDNARRNHMVCAGFDPAAFETVHWDSPHHQPPPPAETREGGRQRAQDIAARTRPALTVMQAVREAARGSERATRRWSAEEKARIVETIIALAQAQPEIIADDIWAACPDVQPGPGIHAVLTGAVREGLLAKGGFAESRRDRADHDHGRRLRVWKSLVCPHSTA